ncbi:MAG: hypothetical protein LDL25_06225 [Hyphomicrobiales bacterium]|uniref:hypothetical protein n=1 Tax=Rhabdaerophilum calidifontis TaxID=2604328 RepID=UPI001FE6713E|nr:hypothetical protein [Rhabdaerophilum calidifontis]MCA1999368.1 hypothetical protein [Hyphomicrobiales bacterium]
MAISTEFGRKSAAIALAGLVLGAGLTMNAADAEARGGRKGAAIAAGIIGAVAAGALIAGAANAHSAPAYYYTQPSYAYEPPSYAYRAPAPVYVPEAVPVYHGGGHGYYGHGYYEHPHRHYHPRRHRSYSETSFHYVGPVCRIRKQRYYDGWGWRVERVQVCR